MKEKDNELQETLAEHCETPGEFIKAVMTLRKTNATTVSKFLGVSQPYISQIQNDKCSLGTALCYKLAKALDINPYILTQLTARYKMKQYIEKYCMSRGYPRLKK